MLLGTDHHGGYDGAVNFERAFLSGSRFTFLKACDGATSTENFNINYTSARSAGILAAPYVWLWPSLISSVKKQTSYWFNTLKSIDAPIAIDFEVTPYKGGAVYPNYMDLYNAIEEYKKLDPTRKILIYTSTDYWKAFGSTDSYFSQFPTWLARYGPEPPVNVAKLQKWTFWQFTELGNPTQYGVWGKKKSIDLNYFHSDNYQELENFFNQRGKQPNKTTKIRIF